QVMHRISPVRGKTHGFPKRVGCFVEAFSRARYSLQVRDAQCIVGIGSARIEADRIVEKPLRIVILANKDFGSSLTEQSPAAVEYSARRKLQGLFEQLRTAIEIGFGLRSLIAIEVARHNVLTAILESDLKLTLSLPDFAGRM